MSAPKSRVKQQQMARKRQRKEAARLKRRRRPQDGWTSDDTFEPIAFADQIFSLPPIKMSVVLEDFAEPYAEGIDDLVLYRRVLLMAMAAWNAALCVEPKRGEMIDKFVGAALSAADLLGRKTMKEFLYMMIERKLRHFDHFLRPILAFDVHDDADGRHLNVASALV